jgi:predicted PurR-regulated permease PerM
MSDQTTTSTSNPSLAAPVRTEHAPTTRAVLDVQARTVVKVLFIAALCWLSVNVVSELSSLIVQLSIALFLAIAADPVVRRLERRGMSRVAGVLVVMSAGFVVLVAALSVFVPPLVKQGDRLVDAAPGIVDDVRTSSWYERIDERFHVVDRISEQAEKLPGIVGDQLGNVVSTFLSGVFGAITILFLTIFLLLGGGQVARGMVRLVPRLTEPRWWAVVQGTYAGVSAFVGGMIVIALMGGTSLAIVAAVLGLPYVLPLGLWMMMLEIIPMIGATIGAIPAVLVAFVAGGTWQGIAMVAFIVVYQQVENSVIQPRVQGRQTDLSPLIVFTAVLVGSQLLGVLGALFAVPVAGVVQIVLKNAIREQGTEHVELPDLFVPVFPVEDEDADAVPDTEPG